MCILCGLFHLIISCCIVSKQSVEDQEKVLGDPVQVQSPKTLQMLCSIVIAKKLIPSYEVLPIPKAIKLDIKHALMMEQQRERKLFCHCP